MRRPGDLTPLAQAMGGSPQEMTARNVALQRVLKDRDAKKEKRKGILREGASAAGKAAGTKLGGPVGGAVAGFAAGEAADVLGDLVKALKS